MEGQIHGARLKKVRAPWVFFFEYCSLISYAELKKKSRKIIFCSPPLPTQGKIFFCLLMKTAMVDGVFQQMHAIYKYMMAIGVNSDGT